MAFRNVRLAERSTVTAAVATVLSYFLLLTIATVVLFGIPYFLFAMIP